MRVSLASWWLRWVEDVYIYSYPQQIHFPNTVCSAFPSPGIPLTFSNINHLYHPHTHPMRPGRKQTSSPSLSTKQTKTKLQSKTQTRTIPAALL